MLNKYKTVYIGGKDEIVEKKSRFVATVQPVHTEEEAISFIESVKKQYWDARHNCFAYVIGERSQIQRCSDDGEPSGTAGKPMLDVLLGEEVHDTVVVVTRYFGGTLLGTGGLVRAYQGATKAGLNASTIIEKCYGRKWNIATDYTGFGKIQYILGQREIPILDTSYTDKVEITVLIPVEAEESVRSEVIEGTNGQADIEAGEACYFAKVNKEMILFSE